MSTSKKTTTKSGVPKKRVTKRAAKQSGNDLEFLHLHEDALQLDPVVPKLPDMPEPPVPMEMGICKHCHMLPAAAYELVIVLSCLVFSLSAVLLTSTQTIERQQDVIATLQKMKTDVYARR